MRPAERAIVLVTTLVLMAVVLAGLGVLAMVANEIWRIP